MQKVQLPTHEDTMKLLAKKLAWGTPVTREELNEKLTARRIAREQVALAKKNNK